MSDKIGTKLRTHCSKCGGDRNCDVKGHFEERGEDEHAGYTWTTRWYLLSCSGCDHVFVQTASTNSDDYSEYDDPSGKPQIEYHAQIRRWPAALNRAKPEWYHEAFMEGAASADFEAVLTETYRALDNDLNRLATVGVRTTFDIAAALLGVDPEKSFAAKLDDLAIKSKISEAEREHLEVLIESGNAAAHRGWKPSKAQINTVMDILESFIYEAFVLPHRKAAAAEKAARLRAEVPRRQRSPKTSS